MARRFIRDILPLRDQIWFAKEKDFDGRGYLTPCVDNQDNEHVCSVWVPRRGRSRTAAEFEEAAQIARLIATAPELLDVCELIYVAGEQRTVELPPDLYTQLTRVLMRGY